MLLSEPLLAFIAVKILILVTLWSIFQRTDTLDKTHRISCSPLKWKIPNRHYCVRYFLDLLKHELCVIVLVCLFVCIVVIASVALMSTNRIEQYPKNQNRTKAFLGGRQWESFIVMYTSPSRDMNTVWLWFSVIFSVGRIRDQINIALLKWNGMFSCLKCNHSTVFSSRLQNWSNFVCTFQLRLFVFRVCLLLVLLLFFLFFAFFNV